MAHTRNSSTHRTTRRRTLRREVPSTVALLTERGDFTRMRRYPSFDFDDHRHYLRQMEGLLRSLTAQGVHVRVALFDPVEYEEYADRTGQDPDAPATRTHYTADVAAGGPGVTYTGQPLDALVTQLTYESVRQATWECGTGLLADAGSCTDCGRDLADAAFAAASHMFTSVLKAAGTGNHHLVCSVSTEPATLLAALLTDTSADGLVHVAETDVLLLCTVLAAGIVTDSPAGVVLRTTTGTDGPDEVRGWSLHDGRLHPLTEAEVFNAYCTDARTGEPVPPEPGVVYRPGTELPPPPSPH